MGGVCDHSEAQEQESLGDVLYRFASQETKPPARTAFALHQQPLQQRFDGSILIVHQNEDARARDSDVTPASKSGEAKKSENIKPLPAKPEFARFEHLCERKQTSKSGSEQAPEDTSSSAFGSAAKRRTAMGSWVPQGNSQETRADKEAKKMEAKKQTATASRLLSQLDAHWG